MVKNTEGNLSNKQISIVSAIILIIILLYVIAKNSGITLNTFFKIKQNINDNATFTIIPETSENVEKRLNFSNFKNFEKNHLMTTKKYFDDNNKFKYIIIHTSTTPLLSFQYNDKDEFEASEKDNEIFISPLDVRNSHVKYHGQYVSGENLLKSNIYFSELFITLSKDIIENLTVKPTLNINFMSFYCKKISIIDGDIKLSNKNKSLFIS